MFNSEKEYKIVKRIIRKNVSHEVTEYLVEWEEEQQKQFVHLKNFKNRQQVFLLYFNFSLPEKGIIEVDEPLTILSCSKRESGSKLLMIEWKKRIDGFKPKNSFVLFQDIKELYPTLLFNYYSKRLFSEEEESSSLEEVNQEKEDVQNFSEKKINI